MAGIGHNSAAAGLDPALEAYVLILPEGEPIHVEAVNEAQARAKCRVALGMGQLPLGSKLVTQASLDQDERARKAAKIRFLLDELVAHRAWLRGEGGKRAILKDIDLTGIVLINRDLGSADLSGADLTGARLTGSSLAGTNLAGAVLRDTDLAGTDLSDADLSHADLRGADLSGARLSGADLWRANLQGCRVAPETLHRAMGCRKAASR